MFNTQEELKKLPQKPGVYIMKDEGDTIIYVGKAINLKNRVRNYFQPASAVSPKVRSIVANINSFEYIVTDTEIEALILENNLIKKHKPRYNVLLKDDKTYPYIKFTLNEDFPRAFSTRKHEKDGAKYFGPYTDSKAVKETLELLRSLYCLRLCAKKISVTGEATRPCLNYHIGRCKAPCKHLISKSDYNKIVREVFEFLNGKHEPIIKKLEEEMLEASEKLDFESAAAIRDKIFSVRKLEENQKLDMLTTGDQDIIAFARDENTALAQVFFMRSGKMTGREHFMLDGTELTAEQEIMTEFITQFYSGTPFIPKELILQHDINDKQIISDWLSQQKGSKVSIIVPQKGEKHKLVHLAHSNAVITLQQFGDQIKREKQKTEGALGEIRNALCIENTLERIEAYDISNIQGYESVGSMIVYEGGKPKRSDYRKFKIKSVLGANDYASMEEVLTRRFKRYEFEQAEENQAAGKQTADKAKFSKLPDIIFVDGGKPQISAAESVLEKLNTQIPVCGMIKDDKHRTRGLLFNDREILLPYTSEGFKLVTRIQDEVHRFAIEYHRKLRSKAQIRSALDDINGIGAKRRKALMKHFGSIDKIKSATVEQLTEVDTMNIKSAEAVYNFFNLSDR